MTCILNVTSCGNANPATIMMGEKRADHIKKNRN